MAHGEGIKQEQGNIAETGELVTKDVGQLRLVSTTEQAISHRRIMALGQGTEGHQVRDWPIGKGGTISRPPPSRPGEFHPEPLTDPNANLSIHPARATPKRLPPCGKTVSSSAFPLTRSRRGDLPLSLHGNYRVSSLARSNAPLSVLRYFRPRGSPTCTFSLRITAPVRMSSLVFQRVVGGSCAFVSLVPT
jgi:hypothetical protein